MISCANLKIVFFAILCTGVCLHIFVLIESEPASYKWRSRSNSDNLQCHFPLDYNNSDVQLRYLWRPFWVDGHHNFSDRIGAQLKWTKTFFENKGMENISGKNILLMFGKKIKGTFWDTDNKVNCPGFSIQPNQCKLTLSTSLDVTNLHLSNFDALIYTNEPDAKPKNLKVPKDVKEIFYTLEGLYSNLHSPFRSKDISSLWSSFARGSDIVTPYSKWVAFDDENVEYFNVRPAPSNLSKAKDYTSGKTAFVAIIVSNCNTVNDRMKYVNELRKYIPVDVFGSCGHPTYPRLVNHEENVKGLKKIVSKYKFYLAFENSNCRDYITEKLYINALENDVVPVVMGAHPDDYKYAAPPHSYIHIEDFQSPKHLADYLVILDKNATMYNQYFLWKGTGTFYGSLRDLFCRVCGMLFYSELFPPVLFSEYNSTWANAETCLPRGRWYWAEDKSPSNIGIIINDD